MKVETKREVMISVYSNVVNERNYKNSTPTEHFLHHIISIITNSLSALEAICIAGEDRVHNTALARRIFDDPRVELTFPIRIWITLPRGMHRKRYLVMPLQSIKGEKFSDYEFPKMDEVLLCSSLKRELKYSRYLVVVYDICSIQRMDFSFFSFKFLRVLDVGYLRIEHFPSVELKLIHLRFLAVTAACQLPSSLFELWNLQTLIVYGPWISRKHGKSPALPPEIWKMHHLRHVKLSAACYLPDPLISEDDGSNALVLHDL
ncbi:hypothetical protein ACH5RR_036551 [Cinchona calisaya]|uniref:Uncharacterized protein n=1 Tax=Cinchona calisaya TaxID=153742 RepID=A0ABD2Y6Q0_9GENT